MASNETTPAPVTTKDLKRVLTFKDPLLTSIGGIIGAGIMSIMGITIGMTGRSVPISLLFAAVFVLLGIAPIIIISGTVRIRGGQYTMVGMLAGKKLSGLFIIIDVATNISLSMYALSFADYFLAFVPQVPRKLIAIAVLTLFWALNMFGIDKMAKLPELVPEIWEKSSFKMSPRMLKVWSRVAILVGIVQLYLLARDLSLPLIIGNVASFIFALIFCNVRSKSPDVQMEISYEAA